MLCHLPDRGQNFYWCYFCIYCRRYLVWKLIQFCSLSMFLFPWEWSLLAWTYVHIQYNIPVFWLDSTNKHLNCPLCWWREESVAWHVDRDLCTALGWKRSSVDQLLWKTGSSDKPRGILWYSVQLPYYIAGRSLCLHHIKVAISQPFFVKYIWWTW